MGGGWVGEIEIKAKLSPAKAGVWAELGNITRDIKKGNMKHPCCTDLFNFSRYEKLYSEAFEVKHLLFWETFDKYLFSIAGLGTGVAIFVVDIYSIIQIFE